MKYTGHIRQCAHAHNNEDPVLTLCDSTVPAVDTQPVFAAWNGTSVECGDCMQAAEDIQDWFNREQWIPLDEGYPPDMN